MRERTPTPLSSNRSGCKRPESKPKRKSPGSEIYRTAGKIKMSKPEINTPIIEIPPEEIKSNSWNDTVKFLKFKLRVWQLIIILLLILAIILSTGFGINAYLNYRVTTNNNELSRELEAAKNDQLELQKITSESLGELKATKTALLIETQKRQQAELILQKDELNTNEKLKTYEQAKKNIFVSNADTGINNLLERAKRLGITPK